VAEEAKEAVAAEWAAVEEVRAAEVAVFNPYFLT